MGLCEAEPEASCPGAHLCHRVLILVERSGKGHLKVLCLGDSVQTRASNELERVSHHTWASSLWGMPGRGRRAPASISSPASGGTQSPAASF